MKNTMPNQCNIIMLMLLLYSAEFLLTMELNSSYSVKGNPREKSQK